MTSTARAQNRGFSVHDATAPARVSVSVQNEPVRAVLIRLSRQTGASITIGATVAGSVTASLRNVPLRDALEAVVAPLGCTVTFRAGVYDVEAAGNASTPSGELHVVLPVTLISASRAAARLRPLFPHASIQDDRRANALVVVGESNDVQEIRAVLQGLDVKNPMQPITEALTLRTLRATDLSTQLHASFPGARFSAVGMKQLIVTATPADLAQIKSAMIVLDAPAATPPPAASTFEAIHVTQRSPHDVARALAAQVPGIRASVTGGTVVLSGPPEAVARAKALVAPIDVPAYGTRYTEVYRVRTLDAGSVADLLRRSFHEIDVTVDSGINAIAVTATAANQQRIADALAQLDPAPSAAVGPQGGASGGSSTDVVTLKSFVPGQTQGGTDAVASMSQAIQVVAPDVRVVQLPTPGQIALVGPPASVRTAREFIDKVDIVPPLVVLDTEVLEVDESTAKNLGLQLGTAAVSTTFSEVTPPVNADGTPGRIGAFQALTRTPITFTAQLNLLVQNGKGRVLADPRITTLSGRTATIRAGDTISILTTTAGNAGTIATTQVQSFQTGVTLDITPSVAPDDGITVALHPVVNSLIGTNNGIPEISTRDTQTAVHLQDNETLVIGGLIQENDTRTTTKLPLLGDLPLVGRAFRSDEVNASRNELIIVVTPHVLKPGTRSEPPGPAVHATPTAQPLPTLPPDARLPVPDGRLPLATGPKPASASAASPAPSVRPSPPPVPLSGPTSPAPQPSAFAQTNVFAFGSAPQSNFARPGDAVQIFFAMLSPTVVADGKTVHIAVITTTNATSVRLQTGTQTVTLTQGAPGRWIADFPFSASSLTPGQTSASFSLVASRSDGSSATVPIPVNVTSP